LCIELVILQFQSKIHGPYNIKKCHRYCLIFSQKTHRVVVLQSALFNDAVSYVTLAIADSVIIERRCSDTGKSNPEYYRQNQSR
jgi:hypothetical protein